MIKQIFSLVRNIAVFLFMITGLLVCSSFTAIGQTEARPSDWPLIWSDEFDSGLQPEYPNPDNWGYEIGYVRNREWQYYTDDIANAYCQNGLLHIRAIRLPAALYPDGSHFGQDGTISSASLISKGRVEQQYGWLEIRARIDTRSGSWPAFWTMGVKGPWPDNGECDIMEYFRGHLYFNAYWWKSTDPAFTPRADIASLSLKAWHDDWSENFHVWAMKWTPDEIRLYLDGEVMNTINLNMDSGDSSLEGFQQPHYMIINQAIGGRAGGDATDLDFPTSYEVDWVRWYG